MFWVFPKSLKRLIFGIDRICSLITPIFYYPRVSWSSSDKKKSTSLMDIKYFINWWFILINQVYAFHNFMGKLYHCNLPLEGFTLLTRLDIEFLPDTVYIVDVHRYALRHIGATSSAPPGPQEDDPGFSIPTQGGTQDQYEMIMPAVTTDYKLPPPSRRFRWDDLPSLDSWEPPEDQWADAQDLAFACKD